MKTAAVIIILVVLIAFAANWLFKERSVEEMKTAKQKIDAMRGK